MLHNSNKIWKMSPPTRNYQYLNRSFKLNVFLLLSTPWFEIICTVRVLFVVPSNFGCVMRSLICGVNHFSIPEKVSWME
jgi:hypothetical protein